MNGTLLERLQKELRDLDKGRLDRTKCADLTLAWLNKVRTIAELIRVRKRDAVGLVLGRKAPLSRELARRILSARQKKHRGRFPSLQAVLEIPGVTTALIEDFMQAICRPQRPRPLAKPTIGVLFPARIETRFINPDSSGQPWLLRFRVVPDVPFFNSHDPNFSKTEFESTQTYLDGLTGDVPASENAEEDKRLRLDWEDFAAAHGAPRAAWLLTELSRHRKKGTQPQVVSDDDTPWTRMEGLPKRLEVWLGRKGEAPTRHLVLNVSQNPSDLSLEIPEAAGDETSSPPPERWWSSWQEAKRVGLAGEIPLPGDPGDIDVMFVVGLGELNPGEILRNHSLEGDLDTIQPGTPTNTVDGEPAASLAEDPEYWRKLVSSDERQETAEILGRFLCGDRDKLRPLPSAPIKGTWNVGSSMMNVLWPALWGHTLKDIWGKGPKVHEVGLWAGENFCPEGPLPLLRFGDQPYGVLPVTELLGWKHEAKDPAVEKLLRGDLIKLRKTLADLAASAGTIEDADTEKVLDLLGHTASSETFAYRSFTPIEIFRIVLGGLGVPLTMTDYLDAWAEANQESEPFLGSPVDDLKMASIDPSHKLKIPLVKPENESVDALKNGLSEIANREPGQLIGPPGGGNPDLPGWPDSLLTRLAVFARLLSAAEVVLAKNSKEDHQLVEPPVSLTGAPTELGLHVQQFHPSSVDPNTPQGRLFESVKSGIIGLSLALNRGVPVATLERILRGIIDSAIYRIDPWTTGFAWRRLESLVPEVNPSGGSPVQYRTGLFAWVDSPAPGEPGPTAGGLLQAPSDAQALTSAILRDKKIHEGDDRWQMDLRSDVIRLAAQIAEDVRLGAHIWEVLGREVESVVADRTSIDTLRRRFPIRAEHEGRRVTNGKTIVGLVRDHPGDSDLLGALQIELESEQIEDLRRIARAVDAYADLLVSQAVFSVVSGRAEVAGAAMDAAAGLSQPPTLDFLTTPRQGRGVNTTVIMGLPMEGGFRRPGGPSPETVDRSPAAIAEPAVADYLSSQDFLADEPWDFQFGKDGRTEILKSVSLSALQLNPVDTLSLSRDKLESLARAAGDVPDTLIPLDTGAFRLHQRARELISLLGKQPVVPADLTDDGSTPDESEVRKDFVKRFKALVQRAREDLLFINSVSDDADRRDALARALQWGITPLEEDLPDDESDRLQILTERAAAALSERSNAVPATKGKSAAQIATAIRELASPEGQLAVLAHLPASAVAHLSPMTSTRNGRSEDADWLSVVSAVRPGLARLEVFQMKRLLAGDQGLEAQSNRPDDLWQADEPPLDPETGEVANTKLLMGYGPAKWAGGSRVALGLVDKWSEAIPDSTHSSSSVFGFNAPASRPPQSVLVAVPPRLDKQLDTATLVRILSETRESLRARMVTHHLLSVYRTAVPLTFLPATGEPSVELRPVEDLNDPQKP